MKNKNVSEFFIIKQIRKKIKINDKTVIKGIGDDTAAIKTDNDKCTLYTCDSLVADIHFKEKYTSPYQLGRKAAVSNISDIASMGGKPKYCLVSLFLPTKTTEKYINELYRGLMHEFKKYNVVVIGGNISKSNSFAVDIFLIGEVSSKNILFRSGAQINDAVLVTGTLGNALHKKYVSSRVPTVRVKEGMTIAQSGKATSMIDISDGLSSDIGHICDESNVGVKIFLEKLPVLKGVKKTTALNGGEDYELCFTVKKKDAGFFPFATLIGEIIPAEKGRWIIDKKGNKNKLIPKGWDHFL